MVQMSFFMWSNSEHINPAPLTSELCYCSSEFDFEKGNGNPLWILKNATACKYVLLVISYSTPIVKKYFPSTVNFECVINLIL